MHSRKPQRVGHLGLGQRAFKAVRITRWRSMCPAAQFEKKMSRAFDRSPSADSCQMFRNPCVPPYLSQQDSLANGLRVARKTSMDRTGQLDRGYIGERSCRLAPFAAELDQGNFARKRKINDETRAIPQRFAESRPTRSHNQDRGFGLMLACNRRVRRIEAAQSPRQY